jgi:Mn-containing catalase
MLLHKARQILNSAGGYDNAVFTALSGTTGGMTKVLNDLAEGFKQEARKAYFDYVVDTFIDPLSFGEIVAVMADLQSCLSGYYPQPFSFTQPEAMAANYKQILWQYMESLTMYKNLWAY